MPIISPNHNRLISIGSILTLAGFILSGPMAVFIVQLAKPQPSWISPVVFAKNYHSIQDLPYYFGLLLIGGMLLLSAAHYLNYRENDDRKLNVLLSLVWTVVFAALILFNYTCQTTFVRHLALNYNPEYDTAIATFSMANPMSFCWANEFWGYGALGIATWLLAGYYRGKNNLIRSLLITNGIVSIGAVGVTIINIKWVMMPIGLISYLLWNALMITLMVLIYRHAKNSQVAETKLTVLPNANR
jgi:hypothetical protein